jgi:hypothetical protein
MNTGPFPELTTAAQQGRITLGSFKGSHKLDTFSNS